jgi:serralysin
VRDNISSGGGNDLLNGGGGTDVLRGGLGNDVYGVDAAGEAIEALDQGTDTVQSSVTYVLGANIERLQLVGGALNGFGNTLGNIITGTAGANVLNGFQSNNVLNGGAGADRFQFSTGLNSLTNTDNVTDFQVGVDKIVLDDAIFTGLPLGPLSPTRFALNAATDPLDRIIYKTASGALFWDTDGDLAGAGSGAAPIRFALVDPGLALTANDFFVV